MTDLVPQAIRDLLAFYAERHPEARFGEMDISLLQGSVASIDEAASDVIAAEAAVVRARERFRDIETDLSAKAARVLSFLKIHVEGDEEQLAELEAIGGSLPATRRRSKASSDATAASDEPRQRRPRKAKSVDDATLALVAQEPASTAGAHADTGDLEVVVSKTRAAS